MSETPDPEQWEQEGNRLRLHRKQDFSAAKQVRFVEMQREPAADGTRHAVVRYHTPDDCAASAHISKVCMLHALHDMRAL